MVKYSLTFQKKIYSNFVLYLEPDKTIFMWSLFIIMYSKIHFIYMVRSCQDKIEILVFYDLFTEASKLLNIIATKMYFHYQEKELFS